MIKIQEGVLLKEFTTFQVGGPAQYFTIVKDEADLREAFAFTKTRRLPFFILGGGSNLLFSDKGFSGLVIKNEIKGIKFVDLPAPANQPGDKVILEVGAGEIWDEVVALSVIRRLSGLENLSGIPGTVGGAIVQNAGAYGQEIKDVLVSVSGLNSINGKNFTFSKAECQYGYRDSFFKNNKKFIITSVTLELHKKAVFNLDYSGLREKFSQEKEVTPQKVREAVLGIRAEKLPDWRQLGTAGSFFMNPSIVSDKYTELKEKFPEIPGFTDIKGKTKVPLAWILDKVCNLKGYKAGQIGLYEKQPIVLVNFGGATGKEIINFAEKIKNVVKEKTGIEIKEEVEIIK